MFKFNNKNVVTNTYFDLFNDIVILFNQFNVLYLMILIHRFNIKFHLHLNINKSIDERFEVHSKAPNSYNAFTISMWCAYSNPIWIHLWQ